LGPHSFRRANITWRQQVGGSAIEASKIAGHSTVRMTEEYTKIQIQRQEDLTCAIQDRLARAGEKQKSALPPAPPHRKEGPGGASMDDSKLATPLVQ